MTIVHGYIATFFSFGILAAICAGYSKYRGITRERLAYLGHLGYAATAFTQLMFGYLMVFVEAILKRPGAFSEAAYVILGNPSVETMHGLILPISVFWALVLTLGVRQLAYLWFSGARRLSAPHLRCNFRRPQFLSVFK